MAHPAPSPNPPSPAPTSQPPVREIRTGLSLRSWPGSRPHGGLAHFPHAVETQSGELPTGRASPGPWLWGLCLLVRSPVLKGHVMCLPSPPQASGRIRDRQCNNEISLPPTGTGLHSCSALAVGLLWLLNVVYRAIKAGLLNARSHWQVAAEWRQGVGMGTVSMAWELTPSRAGRQAGVPTVWAPCPSL